MLAFHPERERVWRLSFIGEFYADDNCFFKMEEDQKKLPPGERTLIVDIRKLEGISSSGQEILPHFFGRMRSHGFQKANLVAKRQQKDVARTFERVLDQVFGPDGTISLE